MGPALSAVRRLEGSWALAVIAEGCDHLVLARHRSPLVVAHTAEGDFAASDMAALTGWVDGVHLLFATAEPRQRLGLLDTQTRETRIILQSGTWSLNDAQMSPDSRFIAF